MESSEVLQEVCSDKRHRFWLLTGPQDPPSRKRTRSLVACSACRKRRSKCEPCLDGSGDTCLRCLQLRTECSFLPGTGRSRRLRWSENSPPRGLAHGTSNRNGNGNGNGNEYGLQANELSGLPASNAFTDSWRNSTAADASASNVSHDAGFVQFPAFPNSRVTHSTLSPLSPAEPSGETSALRAQIEALRRELYSLRAERGVSLSM